MENPIPVLTALDPASAEAGGPGLTLTLHGAGFFPDTRLTLNGQARVFTLISQTQLEVNLGPGDLATGQEIQIRADNSPPGGGASETLSFLVTPVQPLPEGSFGKKYEDLIPADATLQNYDSKRFSLITGLVKDLSGNPLVGVTVAIHSRPEYGTAQTDGSGRFSIPVDGGGVITLIYQKTGYLPSQRQVLVGWNTIAAAETIVLIPEDPAATPIVFDGQAATILTHH